MVDLVYSTLYNIKNDVNLSKFKKLTALLNKQIIKYIGIRNQKLSHKQKYKGFWRESYDETYLLRKIFLIVTITDSTTGKVEVLL